MSISCIVCAPQTYIYIVHPKHPVCCLAQQVFQLWHCEHVAEMVPSGEYVRNTFWYDEYANKASQWFVCLCSRSRSGQLALQAAGQCTGPCTLTVMPLMTNRVKQSHQDLGRVDGCPGFLHSVCESVMCEQ